VAAQQGENYASQNSRQESKNPWLDFWFHIFSYLITSIFFAFSAMQIERSQKNPKKKFSALSCFVVLAIFAVLS